MIKLQLTEYLDQLYLQYSITTDVEKYLYLLLIISAIILVFPMQHSFADTVDISIAQGAGSSANADCVSTTSCFSPGLVQISPGTTVSWKNTDTVGHTVTSGHSSDSDSGSIFDSSVTGLIKPGSDFEFTFQNEGTYNYFCMVHPWMIGQIIVGNGATVTRPHVSVFVSTDKSVYSYGDMMRIYGKTSDSIPNVPVTIMIENSAGTMIKIDQVDLNSDNTYSTQIEIGGASWTSPSIYQVIVQYGSKDNFAQTTFQLVSSNSQISSDTDITITQGAGSSAGASCVSANNCYSPGTFYASAGKTVTWYNTDTVGHTVTSGHSSDSDAGSIFDSSATGLIKPGGKFQFTFQYGGTYNYFCMVHPWMAGTVIVTGNTPYVPPVSIPPSPPAGTDITITQGSGSSANAACVSTNSCFSPGVFSTNSGTTITWYNGDTVGHTVTSGHSSDSDAGSIFDSSHSGLIKPGGQFQFTFYNSGTYNYFCMVHPWMAGAIIVTGNQPTPVSVPTTLAITTDNTNYNIGDTVTTTVTASGPSGGQNVALTVTDPSGNMIISRTVTTDSQNSGSLQFKIPSSAKTGIYQIIATTSVSGSTYKATNQFTVISQQQVSIISVQATDQQGNPVSSFARGTNGFVKVVLSSQSNQATLVTVNLFGSDSTSLGIGSVKTTLGRGQSEMMISFFIPSNAVQGTANLYADVLSDWPSKGGTPLSAESSATVEIK